MVHRNADDALLDALRDASELDPVAARIARAARRARELERDDPDPPADLWARISAEVSRPPASVVTPLHRPEARRPRGGRSFRLWAGAGAAAAAVAVGVTTWSVLTRGSDAGGESVALEAYPGSGEGRATARLIDAGDRQTVELDIDGVELGDDFLEVWLLDDDTEVTKLISLGPVRVDHRYELPAGLDPTEMPVLDVSVEPFDGNPAHSGATVFRGRLVG